MKDSYQKGILIAFGELFLKSKNVKDIFQRRLVQNLGFYLKDEKIHSFRERIFVQSSKTNIIGRVFGIVWFAQCFFFPKTTLKEFSEFIDKNYKDWIKKDETFAIRLKLDKGIIKEDKDKVINKIAKNIKRKVNLSKPKKELFIEIRKNGWFLYFKKKKGAGGLPMGSSGKVLSLVSGGIDSLPSSYLSAKRGAENIWIHFHSFPLVSRASIDKIEELAKVFLKYQPKLKIYFVPFSKAQVKIKAKAPAKYRVLLYRRLMFKIAENIAEKEDCYALITGESLGQVSSQTLPNIKITEEIVKIPILRPLIGMDKEEIIELAQNIGTYDISIKPQEDCCTLFVSKGQTAKGSLSIVKDIEKKLNIEKMVKEAIKEIEVKTH